MTTENSTTIDPNLRKAAVLLRSLDAETAAMMLGQLSAEEAAALRGAMRVLGSLGSEEQAEVLAELGRGRTGSALAAKTSTAAGDVELSLSGAFDKASAEGLGSHIATAAR